LPQPPEGELAIASLLFSLAIALFKVFSGACGSTRALQSLIYVVFLHQQQGVVAGMVAAFLYFAATTNSLEIL